MLEHLPLYVPARASNRSRFASPAHGGTALCLVTLGSKQEGAAPPPPLPPLVRLATSRLQRCGSCLSADASDGDCDDGGLNADFFLCPYSSDCADCGERCLYAPPARPPPPPQAPRGTVCNTPFDLVLVLDRSASMRDLLPELKELAKALLQQLDLGGPQRAAIVSFSRQGVLDSPLTNSSVELDEAIDKLQVEGDTNSERACAVRRTRCTCMPGRRQQ